MNFTPISLFDTIKDDFIIYYIEKADGFMTDSELTKISVDEFSRIQEWMADVDKESKTYNSMYKRYTELKIIVSSLGVNLTELDKIK